MVRVVRVGAAFMTSRLAAAVGPAVSDGFAVPAPVAGAGALFEVTFGHRRHLGRVDLVCG